MNINQNTILNSILKITKNFEEDRLHQAAPSFLVDLWEYNRFPLRVQLIKFILKVDVSPISGQRTGILKKINSIIQTLGHLLILDAEISDVVFDHTRGGDSPSEYVDGFLTKIAGKKVFLFKGFPPSNSSSVAISLLHFFYHLFFPTKLNRYYRFQFEVMTFLISFIIQFRQITHFLELLEVELQKVGGMRANVSRTLLKKYIIDGIKEIAWRYFFSFHHVQRIAVVSSYARAHIIKAANQLGIESFEVQHGTISNIHHGYEGAERLTHFPKNIIVWGEAWKSAFIENHFNFLVLGCPSLREKCLKAFLVPKKDKMVFIGQVKHSALLEEFMYKISENAHAKGIEVVLKIHPNDLIERYKPSKFVRISKADLYSEISDARWVMGTGSTAMYEALASGSEVGIFNDVSYEYLIWLLNKFNKEVITMDDSLESAMQKTILWKNGPEAFF